MNTPAINKISEISVINEDFRLNPDSNEDLLNTIQVAVFEASYAG